MHDLILLAVGCSVGALAIYPIASLRGRATACADFTNEIAVYRERRASQDAELRSITVRACL